MNNEFDFDLANDPYIDVMEHFSAYDCWDLGCYEVEEDYDEKDGDCWLYCVGDYSKNETCPLRRKLFNERKMCFII